MIENKYTEPTKPMDKVVYHYCSIEAMYGILKDKSFWLTSLESSNDSTELKLAENKLKQALEELKIEEPEYIDVYDRILSAPKDKSYIRFRPSHKYYGLSFVEDCDSLTHWERYANDSQGVCIGFNTSYLEFYLRDQDILDFGWIQSIPMIYTYDEQLKFAKNLIINKLNILSNKVENFEKLEYLYSMIYYSVLQDLKPQYKHQGFESEKEHRIYLKEGEAERSSRLMKNLEKSAKDNRGNIFKSISEETLQSADELNILKTRKRYNTFKDGIRGYYAINLSEYWNETLIPEIVLGPKCFQNKKELKNFLKSRDLNKTKVTISKVPLR